MASEEFAYVLDYLATGKSSSYKSEPIAQVLGLSNFTLLEVVPKVSLKIMQKVYIGKDTRKEIEYIKKRIKFNELTNTAQSEIERAIEKIIEEDKQKFLDFYNKSPSISLRMHQLELLPGLGKKHTTDLLRERQIKPFESFEDITNRIKLMPDPLQAIKKRILEELEGNGIKYFLFTRPPVQEKPNFRNRRGLHRDNRNFNKQ